jgi:multimeric flavodoxin WrbA
MSNIAVIFHSGYGHTQRVAQAVAEGAGAELIAIDADGNLPEGAWETLAAADAIVFGSPTYMGGASWQFKKFADASSKVWFASGWKDKLFAGFTNSASMSGDKYATLAALWTLAMQHGGLWVGLGMMPGGNTKVVSRDAPNFVGALRRQPGRDGARRPRHGARLRRAHRPGRARPRRRLSPRVLSRPSPGEHP